MKHATVSTVEPMSNSSLCGSLQRQYFVDPFPYIYSPTAFMQFLKKIQASFTEVRDGRDGEQEGWLQRSAVHG